MMRLVSIFILGLLGTVTLGWAAPLSSQDDTAATRAQALYDQGVTDAEHGFSDERLRKALTSLEQAIALAPNWPDPYYSAALVQIRLGRLLPAATNLRTYLRLRPDAPNRPLIESLISELEARAPTEANRELIIEMLSTKDDTARWQSSRNGSGLMAILPKFHKSGNSLGVYLPPTNSGQTFNNAIALPEAGVKNFTFALRIRGMVNVPPCPCDLLLHYTVTIKSRDQFEIRVHSVSNNREMPLDSTTVFTFTRRQGGN